MTGYSRDSILSDGPIAEACPCLSHIHQLSACKPSRGCIRSSAPVSQSQITPLVTSAIRLAIQAAGLQSSGWTSSLPICKLIRPSWIVCGLFELTSSIFWYALARRSKHLELAILKTRLHLGLIFLRSPELCRAGLRCHYCIPWSVCAHPGTPADRPKKEHRRGSMRLLPSHALNQISHLRG